MPIQSIVEGDLEFSFDNPIAVERFDDDTTHGMGHVMKRVDFRIDLAQATWLIEVKDPENRRIPPAQTTRQRANFRKKMRSETLYRRELAPKLKDTLVYLALANRAPSGQIVYIAVIAIEALTPAMLLTATEKLKRLCYLPGPFGRPWHSQFSVIVVNHAEWNRTLQPHSVHRP